LSYCASSCGGVCGHRILARAGNLANASICVHLHNPPVPWTRGFVGPTGQTRARAPLVMSVTGHETVLPGRLTHRSVSPGTVPCLWPVRHLYRTMYFSLPRSIVPSHVDSVPLCINTGLFRPWATQVEFPCRHTTGYLASH
jgi:hypothetical protein